MIDLSTYGAEIEIELYMIFVRKQINNGTTLDRHFPHIKTYAL